MQYMLHDCCVHWRYNLPCAVRWPGVLCCGIACTWLLPAAGALMHAFDHAPSMLQARRGNAHYSTQGQPTGSGQGTEADPDFTLPGGNLSPSAAAAQSACIPHLACHTTRLSGGQACMTCIQLASAAAAWLLFQAHNIPCKPQLRATAVPCLMLDTPCFMGLLQMGGGPGRG